MAETLARRETTAGNIYEKRRDTTGRDYYVNPGSGRVSQNAWAAANRHRTGTTEIATPEGYTKVDDDTASRAGQAANYEEVDDIEADTIVTIKGQEYTAEELSDAYEEAGEDQPDMGAVRYL